MTDKKRKPASFGDGTRAGKNDCSYSTARAAAVNPRFFNAQGLKLADQIERTERQLLAEGWFHPERMYDAACDVGLTGTHFSRGKHSYIFALECLYHENGLTPQPCDAIGWVSVANVVFEPEDLVEIVCYTDSVAELIPFYAENVVLQHEMRERAHTAFIEYADILGDGGYEFELIIRRKGDL